MERKRVVAAHELTKRYGSLIAVDAVSFEVGEGEIFGIVGPNGAGKTTTIECLEGLRKPDAGSVRVFDIDPWTGSSDFRERVGVQLQESRLQARIKVWEALDLYASFYSQPANWEDLLEALGIAEKRDVLYGDLSGGQKQRLFIALALVNDPELVFLDELTTGLDPHARRIIWDLVRGIRERGKTVLLSTHFMEGAERLCDRVAVVDRGKIVALDSPEHLIRSLGAHQRIVFTADPGLDPDVLTGVPGVVRTEISGDRVTVYGDGDRVVSDVLGALASSGTKARDLRTEQPNLEDVFLELTGRPVGDQEE